jgi:4-alpha-glucanotransferase
LNVPGTNRERPNWRRRNRQPLEDLDEHSATIEAVRRGRAK